MIRMTTLLVLCLGLTLPAQLPLQTSLTLNNVDAGRSIALLGDVNGDGIGDYVHGPTTFTALPLRVRSGLDSSLIYSVPVPPGGTSFGVELTAIGDVDADGVQDFISLRGEGVAVAAFSGATGALLNHVPELAGLPNFGWQAISVGDINGDSLPDVAISWIGPLIGQQNLGFGVYSGLNGTLIRAYTETGNYLQIAPMGDVNADGVPDIGVVVDNFATPIAGRVFRVLSGANNSLLFSLDVPIGPDRLTDSAALGDINGDGFADFALTFKDANVPSPPLPSHIDAISGQDGSILWTRMSEQNHYLAQQIRPSADVNGDGVLDVITIDEDYSTLPHPLRILALNGQDGSTVGSFRPSNGYVQRLDFDAGQDVNGDGITDLAYVVWDDLGSHVGLFSFMGAQRYGAGQGGLQTLDMSWQSGLASSEHQGQLVLSGAPSLASGLIFATIAPGNSMVSGLPILLDVDPANLTFQSAFLFDATGSLFAPIDLQNTYLAGTTLFLQSFILTPSLACSNGLELLFSH